MHGRRCCLTQARYVTLHSVASRGVVTQTCKGFKGVLLSDKSWSRMRSALRKPRSVLYSRRQGHLQHTIYNVCQLNYGFQTSVALNIAYQKGDGEELLLKHTETRRAIYCSICMVPEQNVTYVRGRASFDSAEVCERVQCENRPLCLT